MKYADGSYFAGEFTHGLPIKGHFEYANKDSYTGQLKNNKPHGEGILKNKRGKYEGKFENGQFINGTAHYTDRSVFKGYMVDGLRHGPNC
jgi:hypothetical protein